MYGKHSRRCPAFSQSSSPIPNLTVNGTVHDTYAAKRSCSHNSSTMSTQVDISRRSLSTTRQTSSDGTTNMEQQRHLVIGRWTSSIHHSRRTDYLQLFDYPSLTPRRDGSNIIRNIERTASQQHEFVAKVLLFDLEQWSTTSRLETFSYNTCLEADQERLRSGFIPSDSSYLRPV